MALLALYTICLAVGILVGGTGMGGILIPPALVLLSGLKTHAAMATTLASFIPMNVLGCYLFHRLGHIHWRQALPFTLGGALAAGPAALFNVHLHASFLNILLALLVLFAAFSSFKPPVQKSQGPSFWLTPKGLGVIGMVTGTMAGITGAGGPLLAIAWMVPCGMPPLAAVGLTMPYSLATALTASWANWLNGNVDGPMLLRVSGLELAGFICGVFAVSHMPVLWVRRLMAVTCAILGLFLLVRSLFLPI
ncbi:MAG: sulfite exporter TauE/SafE family protein [Desulfovibrio sp.]|nr:sulfite exporter TauE/SafE family protein [Desulfovibrio sp.]